MTDATDNGLEKRLDDVLVGVVRRAVDAYLRGETVATANGNDHRSGCDMAGEFDADAMRFLLREAVAGDQLASDLFLGQVLNRSF